MKSFGLAACVFGLLVLVAVVVCAASSTPELHNSNQSANSMKRAPPLIAVVSDSNAGRSPMARLCVYRLDPIFGWQCR